MDLRIELVRELSRLGVRLDGRKIVRRKEAMVVWFLMIFLEG